MISILGCCRQDSLKDYFNVTSVRDRLTYCHYPNEALQALRFIAGYSFNKENCSKAFRICQITNRKINQKTFLNEFKNTKLFVLEIATPNEILYENIYCHEEIKKNYLYKNIIRLNKTSKNEIINTLKAILKIIGNKKLMVVSHIYNNEKTSRAEFSKLIKEICFEMKIPFFDTMFYLRNEDYDKIFVKEEILAHYTDYGHSVIGKLYANFIKEFFDIDPNFKLNSRFKKKFNSYIGRFYIER